MTQNISPTFVKTPNRGVAQISTGTGTNSVTLYTGGANGSKITGINLIQNSSGTPTVVVYFVNGGTNYFLTQVTVPSNTPTAVLGLISGLPVDSDANPYLLLASSADTVIIQSLTTIPTAATFLSAYAVAGDF
jgi:hypothetical protein